VIRQRVDDRDADAVQAAGGLVGLARELAAGVKGAEDDLERALVGEFRMRIDGDAAAVVADRDGVVGVQLDLDAGGVAGDGLVHGVVEHFGDEVVQARSSVPPIYMPGRLRTGSSPSSTSMDEAS
jgi:hypothetical protein